MILYGKQTNQSQTGSNKCRYLNGDSVFNPERGQSKTQKFEQITPKYIPIWKKTLKINKRSIKIPPFMILLCILRGVRVMVSGGGKILEKMKLAGDEKDKWEKQGFREDVRRRKQKENGKMKRLFTKMRNNELDDGFIKIDVYIILTAPVKS